MVHGDSRHPCGRSHRAAARAYVVSVIDRVATRPVAVTVVLASLLLVTASYRLFHPMGPEQWPYLGDSVIFEYVGWYVTQGNRLYVDVWAVKPPLAFEVPAVLALLSGRNVARYHVLNLFANGVAVVAGAAMAAGIVHELTDDFTGAVVAGVATFTLPYFFFRALIGFKAKYFVVATGLACLYFAYRERPIAAGVAGAAAVGFWQLAVVFPLAGLGRTWQRTGRPGAKRFLAASVFAGTVVLLPVILWGVVPAMVAEVLFAPLLVPESADVATRIARITGHLGTTLPVALIGVAGLVGGGVPARVRDEWPLVLVAGWLTLAILAFDYDFIPDLFPWFAVVAIGVGMVVGRVGATTPRDDGSRTESGSRAGSRALGAAIVTLAVLSVATLGGFGTGETDLTDYATYEVDVQLEPGGSSAGAQALVRGGEGASDAGPTDPSAIPAVAGDPSGTRNADDDRGAAGVKAPYQGIEAQYVYWNRVEIATCRAFGGHTQSRLVDRLDLVENRPWYEAPCGRFTPAWRALTNETVG